MKTDKITEIEEAKIIMFDAIERLRRLRINCIPKRKQKYIVEKLEKMK